MVPSTFTKPVWQEGIKPIIGIDAFLAPRTRFDKDTGIDRPRSRLVLLAKNNKGYQNLIELVTRSYVDGFYYRPRLDQELLKKHSDNLICIIPSFAGEVAQALKDNDTERAGAALSWYRDTYGTDCYLEISHRENSGRTENQERIIKLAKETNTPLVAAHDVYYVKQSDAVARETMIAIQSGNAIDPAEDRTEDFSFITQAQALNIIF
ncbi:MAG: PHP domain-containing protein [Candidatus Paceibacterota bacterium]